MPRITTICGGVLMSKTYFMEAAVATMVAQGFDGLACDPDAYECNGCSLDNISPDDCLNPDCYGAHCTCHHQYQDEKYGQGQRVHNIGAKDYSCTVCGKSK